MKSKYSFLFVFVFLVGIIGFSSGYNNGYSDEGIYQTSENSLIDCVNTYAKNIVKGIENEYIDVGIKASVGITEIKIEGEYAQVNMVMQRYDPLIKESFKSFHTTQWKLKDGNWVI